MFTSKDHRLAAALKIDLGEPPPTPTDKEIEECIAAALSSALFDDEYEPTLRDWQEHSSLMEAEALSNYRNWKLNERRADKEARAADNLRGILFLSLCVSSVLMIALGAICLSRA